MAAGPDRNAADASPVRRHPRWRPGSAGPRRASPGHGWSAPVADRAEHVWLLRPADAESAAHAVRCAGPASIPASKSAPAAGHADAATVAAWYPPCAGTPWTHFHLNSPTVPDTAILTNCKWKCPMSRFRDRQAPVRLPQGCALLNSRRRWQMAHAALLSAIAAGALAADHHAYHEHHDAAQLAPVVITGVGQQSALTVITDPKIPRQPVPASDAGDYLQTIPGFAAVSGGGSNSDPVFRGMFGSRLKLLSNGGEMLGACPSRMDSPSSYITPENYDSLTVIKGPQTVLWGPGNSAATVLFERDPESFTEPDARIDASVLGGSHG